MKFQYTIITVIFKILLDDISHVLSENGKFNNLINIPTTYGNQ